MIIVIQKIHSSSVDLKTNFEVIRAKEKKHLKKLPNKKIIQNENNNEIKVLKK